MSRLFDSIVIVDWSAAATPSPKAPSPNAIWIGVAGHDAGEPRYFRTRATAEDWIRGFLSDARMAGRRVLVGFDFSFGYPRGFAERLTGRASAMAVWDWLATHLRDGPDNANNRFEVAATLNGFFPGEGPFWGRPSGLELPDLPERGKTRTGHGLPERRRVEEIVPGAQPVWKLYTTGSVGSQALTGQPVLQRLRNDPALRDALAIWPMETGAEVPEAPLVFAEVYPSLLNLKAGEGEVLDAIQVSELARHFHELDGLGELANLFTAPDSTGIDAARLREEGWILGAGTASTPGLKPLRNDCFALPPGVDWVPVDAALTTLRDGLDVVASVEHVPLVLAGGRLLAEAIRARRSHPPAANAAVDGYGFAHASLGPAPFSLPLVDGRAAAGQPLEGQVPAGQAVRILTGAVLPAGVDTVVMEEDVTPADGEVRFRAGLKPGANTRPAGEDSMAGSVLLPAGHRLAPQDLALAASCGLGVLPVRRKLRVGVLSTGDEIVAPEMASKLHQTPDANRPMLLEILRRWDMEPVDLGHASDSGESVGAALADGAARADAILTSGGASAGDEDHVSRLLRECGALTVWRIAIKPGRPLALGVWEGRPVFGLPGNPVAAFVCTLIFARPALLRLAGAPWEGPRGLMLPAAFTKSKKAGRREYLRARLDASGRVEVFASEGSGRISGLSWAQGLVQLDDPACEVRPGDPVRYLPFADFGL